VEPTDSKAASQLLTLVYDELRRLAAARLAQENPGQTLQATALVHEAWLHLSSERRQPWQNRAHFFAAAAEAMRRILIDNARRKQAARRGGNAPRLSLEELDLACPMPDEQLLALHEALERLAERDPVKAELVKLRFFAGLSMADAAKALELSEPTAKRYWSYARAWLFRELKAMGVS
jgi:RNA polymerase sigma factor (TIGR02999 family)